jgi:NADH dehydrogenase [ubiquinone] 1 alpha subcomplex assembly factor 7
VADLAGEAAASPGVVVMGAQRKIQTAEPGLLAARLKETIARDGPISVHDYMQVCLADRDAGYYTMRQPIGRDGDFVTAPEISQMFGELIGIWAAAVWHSMGEPEVTVAELGPGRGTLMADALRVFGRVPGLLERLTVVLVETSPVLRETQAGTLGAAIAPLQWCDSIEGLPRGPLIIIANEFIDALPVRQLLREGGAWRERCVTLDDTGAFAFRAGAPAEPGTLPQTLSDMNIDDGAIVETRPAVASLVSTLAERAKDSPVAALFTDYGHAKSGFGDTLQAVRRHRFADPLAAPGETDLTAHVDFGALKDSARRRGLVAYGPMNQGEFLLKLGLEARCERLLRNATPEQKVAILSGVARLTDPRQMGVLFKMLALQSSGLAPPPPFGDS